MFGLIFQLRCDQLPKVGNFMMIFVLFSQEVPTIGIKQTIVCKCKRKYKEQWCYFTYFLAKMSQTLVEMACNTSSLVKKSQQLELNKQLSVNKDISTAQISSTDYILLAKMFLKLAEKSNYTYNIVKKSQHLVLNILVLVHMDKSTKQIWSTSR